MTKHFKYLLLTLFILLIKFSFAQRELDVRLGSFTDGSIVSVEDVLKYPSLTVVNRNSNGTTKLLSYDCVFPSTDKKKNTKGTSTKKNDAYTLSAETIAMLQKCLPGENFAIRNIQLEIVNIKTGVIEIVKMDPIVLKIAAKSGGSMPAAKVDYVGKLITGKNHDQPVSNQKVILQSQEDKDLQSTITDSYGDFRFSELSSDKSYKINVVIADDAKIKDGQLYAAKPDGTVIRSFNKTNKGYEYELLPAELTTLAREKEEDTELKIRNFGTSNKSTMTVIENVYYDPNSPDVKTESVEKLDKIISAMLLNKSLTLSINSHTDSKGEDAYNMTLSEKRAQKVMEYFILKGIEKSRLSAKGFGETQIKNRCINGIDCSETEHMLNRRTEFNFTK
jgi:outer membrane protein OmpA-like peptidoglycan-associated protein